MIYNTSLSALLPHIRHFLQTVEDETTLVSRENFDKYPAFSLFSHEIEQFMDDCEQFIQKHPKYTTATRSYLESKDENLSNIRKVFSIEKPHNTYSSIKNGLKNIYSSKIINKSTFTLYKTIFNFPYDINNNHIELLIDENNNLFLDLQNLGYLIQALNFPLSFKKLNNIDFNVKISTLEPFDKIQKILPSIKPIDDRLNFLENTPINLSDLIFSKGLVKGLNNTDIYSTFIENTQENQMKIYESFKNNPYQSSIDGLSYYIHKEDRAQFKLIAMDYKSDEFIIDQDFILIPFQYNTPASFIEKLPHTSSLINDLSLFLDSNKKYDNFLISTVIHKMISEDTLFINTSFKDIIYDNFFEKYFHNKSELVRIQKNMLFLYDVINQEYKNIQLKENQFSELIKLSLLLGYKENNNDKNKIKDSSIYLPLLGKTQFLSQKDNPFYSQEYAYNNYSKFHSAAFSNVIKNEMFTILTEIFENNLEAFIDYIIFTEAHPLFADAFELFFQTKFPHLSKAEIIKKLLLSDNDHLLQLSSLLFISDSTLQWQDITSDINSVIKAFYFSNFKYIINFFHQFHIKVDLQEIMKNKSKIEKFNEVMIKTIRYKGIYHEESNILDDFPVSFFIDFAKSEEILQIKSPNIAISSNKLMKILEHENLQDLKIFLNKFGHRYQNIDSSLFSKKHIVLLHELLPNNTKSFINNLVMMEAPKYFTQEYFDFFMNISPLSTISIVDKYPISIISTPKNMINILFNIINNDLDAKKFYLKVTPEVYHHYNNIKEDINTINQSVLLLLEENILTKNINKTQASTKILKF